VIDRIINFPWAFISRYAIDIVIILLVLRWVTRKKRRRKKFLGGKVLFRLAVVFLLIYFVIPQGLSRIVPRARYFPQLLEAHKLRLYYTVYAAIVPGKGPSQEKIEREISAAAARYGFNPALIRAVVKVESGFNQFALSSVGGCGLMQVLPSTYFSLRGGNPFGVKDNLNAGTKYLNRLYNRFNGNVRLTLAAYNGGPSRIERLGKVPASGETSRYVKAVLSYYELYKQ
jgi:soluble lytic murein transglycosylase-like protein